MAIDRLVGIYHFLGDRAPKDAPVVPPRPRRQNRFLKEGKPTVTRVSAGMDIAQSVRQVLELVGAPGAGIARGDRVLVKPNFNSPDPYPASTDLAFLRAVVEILREAGANVTIGESAGGVWRPTVNVFRKLRLYELASSLGAKLIAFENEPDGWVRVAIEGEFLQSLTMPRSAYEADRIIYLPCMKTHQLARFSGAMKLAFGFVHPGERRAFHFGHLEQKLAEVSLCWQPDIIIMDGRKSFVTGGPSKGRVVEPGVIMASGDLVAIDVEAVKTLLRYDAANRLTADPWQLPQVVAALKYQLGSPRDGYLLLET